MSRTQVVILAAGMGKRLGRPLPKALTPLASGKTIMQQQWENLDAAFGEDLRVTVAVGFKMELLMEALPQAVFVYNERYDQTNTCKSLLKALCVSDEGGVLWLNGDVVFDRHLLDRVKPLWKAGQSFVCVNGAQVGDEEVKYKLGADGFVRELSKTVRDADGEAVGINFIAAGDKQTLIEHLERCDDQDYFERGIETAIAEDGLRFSPVDISEHFAVEVDFEEDLERANRGV